MDIVTEVQEQIALVAQPLADRLVAVERMISDRERELNELRKLRTQLRGTIKGIDPSLISNGDKPKARKNSNDWMPKAASVEKMREFLIARTEELNEGVGFHAAGLLDRYPKDLPIAYSSIHKVLGVLHDQGLVRLDSTGTGGAKYYKVVT